MSKKSRQASEITNAEEGGSNGSFDFHLDGYSGASNSDGVYTTSDDDGDALERGQQAQASLDRSDHTAHSATYIS